MKQLEADIVIIAAGPTGLAAAITTGEGGARVIAFEKSSLTGGSANMGNGLFAVESRLQRLKQSPLTREEAFKIHMDFTHWRVDARLVKTYIDKSAETIDWLEQMGVEFYDLASHGHGMNYTWHLIKEASRRPGFGAAATMMQIMTERAKELGVQILLKTPAKEIIKKEGRIVGAVAEDRSGETIRAKAKAVIIATGGYGGGTPGFPGLVGDGIRMAKELGAVVTEKATPVPNLPHASTSAVNSALNQPNLMVNLLGERFMNEEIMVANLFGRNAIARQKKGCAVIIFDETTKNYYVEKGFDFVTGYGVAQMSPLSKATDFDSELKQILDRGSDRIFMADSLEELADKTGVNPNALQKTVDEYNHACETGRDEIFNKNPRYLRPVKQPRFYASKIIGGAPGVLWEGIRINYKTEVLTEDFEVIPGLYAAGTDAACNIYYDTYPNVLPGNGMSFAINSGRIAGENALEYIKSLRK